MSGKRPDPAPPESLAALQRRFAAHIRDPEHQPAPEGIEDRRMAIYRRLFFNNLSNLFGKNFRAIRGLMDDADWQRLIRAFLADHRPTTPLFPEIGREFVRYLADHADDWPDYPWLTEAADWTFLLTIVRNDEAQPESVPADPDGDLLASPPRLNPTLRMAHYRWPVHEIRADQAPAEPAGEPVLLMAWRTREERIGQMRINAVTARLVELMQEDPECSGLDCLEQLAREMQHPDPDALATHGRSLLESLRDRQAVLGTRAESG